MEVNRLKLHSILEEAMLSAGEEPHLYYQPPENVKLVYPCIIYQLASFTSRYADNLPYHQYVHFDVTYITRSPKSYVPVELVKTMNFNFDRYFVADNLHHYAYRYIESLKEESHD